MTATHINMGCGEFKAPAPWLNIDVNPDLKPDLVASVTELPFADSTVDRIYAGHVIEHLDYWSDVPTFIKECHRLLKSDGILCVVAPDILRARVMVDAGTQPQSLIKDIEAGADRWSGDHHHWTARASLIEDALTGNNFEAVEVSISGTDLNGWPVTSRTTWQCAFLAKPL